MKQIPSDKYNVAWFTLAECVARGEKVRALSLYRLLSHSIEDDAFTRQLKGDLLLAFKDVTAIELYEEAAELYLKDNRLLEAAGIFEHLFSLEPGNYRYIKALVKLYNSLGINSKVDSYIQRLLEVLIKTQDLKLACDFIDQFEETCQIEAVSVHQQFILYFLQQNVKLEEVIVEQGKKVIKVLASKENKELLQRFLSNIELLNTSYYLLLLEHAQHLID